MTNTKTENQGVPKSTPHPQHYPYAVFFYLKDNQVFLFNSEKNAPDLSKPVGSYKDHPEKPTYVLLDALGHAYEANWPATLNKPARGTSDTPEALLPCYRV